MAETPPYRRLEAQPESPTRKETAETHLNLGRCDTWQIILT